MAASGPNPKKRNSLAGTKTGKSVSARRLQKSAAARKKHNEKNKAYGSTTKQKKDRAKHTKIGRAKGTYGNGDGKDWANQGNGTYKKESPKKNRNSAKDRKKRKA